MELEYFIDVIGFKGFYRCSNYGRVVSVKTALEICTSVNKLGYKTGALYKNGVRKCVGNVGSLILASFYPRPQLAAFKKVRKFQFECCHIDSNPANNHISNLIWGTPKLNGMHKRLKNRR